LVFCNRNVTGGQSGYDGSNDAWLLSKTATFGRIQIPASVSGVHTASLYVKAGTLSWIRFLMLPVAAGTDPQVYVNLSDGSLGSQYNNITATSTSVGGGWYRITLTFQQAVTEFRIYPADGNNNVSGTSGNIYIQNAQLEAFDIATDYIATTSAAVSVGPVANVPRLDYLGSSCPRLLLEPQRTNLLNYSENFDNAYWSKTGATITANTTTSPDGYVNADTLVESSSTAIHAVFQNAGVTIAVGTATFSVFVKPNGRNFFQIRTGSAAGITNSPLYANFDLVNDLVTAQSVGANSAKIESYSNGWKRCSISFTITSGSTVSLVYQPITSGTAVIAESYAGDGTSGIYLWGAQLEAASYATSYIPTLGAAVTRGEDNTLTASLSGVLPQTAGTLFWDIEYTFLAASTMLMHNTGVSDYCFLQVSSGGLVEGGIYESGVEVDRLAKVDAIATGRHKMAFAYSTNSFALYVDGVLADSGSSGSTANISMNTISLDWNATDFTRINQALLFPTRLSNSSLAELTSL
jgi:hypothetical protein